MFSESIIKKNIPHIIDAYVEIFGDEYRNIITEKINNLEYCIYDNTKYLDFYYSFLLKCKQRELSIRFLELLGIDVSKNDNKTFFYELDNELNSLVTNFIGDYSKGLGTLEKNNFYGALSFRSQFSDLKEYRIKFINFLKDYLGDSSILNITIDTLDDFYNTQEYNKIKPYIDLAIKSYDTILLEYEKYKISLEPYLKSIHDKQKIKPMIIKAKTQEFLKQISYILPLKMRIQMLKNNLTMDDFLASFGSLYEKSDIEFFSEFDNMQLADPDVDEFLKQEIMYFRKHFFSLFGVDTDLYSYEELIKKYKDLIPPESLIEKITQIRGQKIDEVPRDYCKAINSDIHSSYLKDSVVYTKMCNNTISICPAVTFGFRKLYLTLFFTCNPGNEGSLDYILLHELCHLIESFITDNTAFSGFDVLFSKKSLEKNPYNILKRKYEILNESIADIFSTEALKIIRSKDIYIFEEKNNTKKIEDIETASSNSHPLIREILRPFVFKFKDQLVKAMLTGNSFQLFSQIGATNFELLNDSINKLDYLLRKNRITSVNLHNCDDFELISNELIKIKQIYKNMDYYMNINMKVNNNNNSENSPSLWTKKEKVR